MTSTEPSSDPARPSNPADAALFDAVAVEHGIIYGYGLVSAHSSFEENALIATAMAEHRTRREAAIAMLDGRGVTPPLPAAGYRVPDEVTDPAEAAGLAVRMEKDAAVAWRAVLEQAASSEDRAFAVTALTEAAVTAAQWNEMLDVWPVSSAFPGGGE
ncbi:ferritin-like domain-containing protein [Mycobacterium sp. NPDC003449]